MAGSPTSYARDWRPSGLLHTAPLAPGGAAGTFDDPYFASGLIFGGCYPVLMR